ncbi:MAG: DUF1127 domain-containing protein [Geminicoccaceae bacterium]|nr:DUF1127 domain-containing protein [Geminicoccaceae bacterium]
MSYALVNPARSMGLFATMFSRSDDASFLDRFRAWQQRRALIATTRRELSALSDNDLRDIGIHRSQIAAIACGSVER